MAKAIAGRKVILKNGKKVKASNGNWYDNRQYYNGLLGKPGEIIVPDDEYDGRQR